MAISNLKKIASFGITLGGNVAKILQDGKVTLAEGLSLLPDLLQISDIVASIPAIKEEFKAMTSEDRAELNSYIAENFDIDNDVLEAKIEKAVAAALAILDLVSAFKAPEATTDPV